LNTYKNVTEPISQAKKGTCI